MYVTTQSLTAILNELHVKYVKRILHNLSAYELQGL